MKKYLYTAFFMLASTGVSGQDEETLLDSIEWYERMYTDVSGQDIEMLRDSIQWYIQRMIGYDAVMEGMRRRSLRYYHRGDMYLTCYYSSQRGVMFIKYLRYKAHVLGFRAIISTRQGDTLRAQKAIVEAVKARKVADLLYPVEMTTREAIKTCDQHKRDKQD